ncbi:MAG: hypothetical protein KME30_27050 [Iphinoe sp. HA4291-MV1]|jgi:hypothetical protein|nr:hypothetical protein [Iphinoe sp. HA4291-MV1]
MSKLKGKALEVLDICLSGESPEVKAKVYQIIEVSQLEPNDPMFLVLALTGQMRVLLETAPAELSKLLKDWKEQSERNLQAIEERITQITGAQEQQASLIRETLEQVTSGYVEGMKKVGMATTSAISAANNETLEQAQLAVLQAGQLKEEVIALRNSLEQERKASEKRQKVLLEQVEEPIKSLNTATKQINIASAEISRLQKNTIGLKFASWFSPLSAIAVTALASFACGLWVMLLKYNDSSNVLGRNLVQWNLERILKCQDDKNPKCTIWIVTPPEKRK